MVGKQEVEFPIAPGLSINGLPVTCPANSKLECERYTGVGFDALARDGKLGVLHSHNGAPRLRREKNTKSKALPGTRAQVTFSDR